MNASFNSGGEKEQPTRELTVLIAGARRIGIPASEIGAIANWREPTPLPQAPKSILGIVCIQGRMLTLIDSLGLLGELRRKVPDGIVALRGDEQLALAVDGVAGSIEFTADELKDPNAQDSRAVLGNVSRGEESITVLNVGELFAAAMLGYARRRRRF